MAIIYGIFMRKIHLQCTFFSISPFTREKLYAMNIISIMSFLPYPLSCTQMSCIFLFESLIIRMVGNHTVSNQHIMHVQQNLKTCSLPAHSANFENGMETRLNTFGIILIRLKIFSLPQRQKKVRSQLHFTF